MKKISFFFVFLAINSFLVCRCFVAASAESPIIFINGTNYVSVDSLIADKGYQTSWDALLKNIVIKDRLDLFKFHVGSEYGLSQGKLIKLEDKVRFFKGQVIVPASAGSYFNHPVFNHLTISSQPTRPTTRLISQSLYGNTPVSVNPAYFRVRRVVIDAGHGGRDYGAISLRGTREKDLTLGVARMLREELEGHGIEVIMTRNSDVFIPLERRAAIANKKNADFFISIHANASLSRSLQGFEVYYLSEATDDASLALERAENSVLKLESSNLAAPDRSLKTIYWDLKETENRKESIRIANDVADAVESSVEISHRRIKAANFYVLKWTECPAVLVELGYITNPGDERRLKSSIYRKRLVEGIMKGLLEYKELFEKTDGFTQ